MSGSILGGLFTGLGSLFGGLIGGDQAQKGAIKGAKLNMKMTKWAARQNLKWQQKFARRSIRWRTKDAMRAAQRAGISPLVAMGVQPQSFTPSFTAGDAGSIMATGAANAGNIYAQMGQDIGRAAGSMFPDDDRMTGLALRAQELQLENMSLQNMMLASSIAKQNQPGNPPAVISSPNRFLVDGQSGVTSSPLVDTKPVTRLASDPDKNWQEGASVTDKGWLRTQGGWSPVRSNDASQRLEDDLWGNLVWGVRNRIAPILNQNLDNSGPFKLRPGYHWQVNPVTDQWIVIDNGGNHVPDYRP